MSVEVLDVECVHVRRGRHVRAVWTALAVHRRQRESLPPLATWHAVTASTRAGVIKRAHAVARRFAGGVS